MSDLSIQSRWTIMRPHEVQHRYWTSPHRFNVIPAGRRSGKTELFKRKLVRKALQAAFPWKPAFFAGAPTRDQAKRIFWDDLKALVGRDMMARPPSETELMIETINGAEIWVIGMDKPERVEGKPWDGGGLDEFANCKPNAWKANIRPALSDRQGWFDLFGVPEGRNHYYELNESALSDMEQLGAASEWGSFSWKSADILPAAEIAAARRDLDELTFLQEYEASFVNFEGRCYYPFDSKIHCAPLKYDERADLILCFDFNVAPGCAAIIQEQVLPGLIGKPTKEHPLGAPVIGTGVISEVFIPRNSNTPAVCRKILADFENHKGRVRCYGDATGGADGSAKVQGSDWDLIEKELRPKFKDRLFMDVKPSNPAERARVNAVNSRLKSAAGDIRLLVDRAKAPHVVKDFDGVTLLKGGSGEIDKKATPELTHLTDGIGYYIESKYPVSGPGLIKVVVAGR